MTPDPKPPKKPAPKKKRERLKPISLHPLKPEEALKAFMEVRLGEETED